MDTSRGWGYTPGEIRQILLLDWIHEQTDGDSSRVPDLGGFAEKEDLPSRLIDDDATALEEQGLLHVSRRLGGIGGAWLTAEGRQTVEARQQRRDDPIRRRRACRDAFLSWLARQNANGKVPVEGFFTSDLSIYEGEQFTRDDLGAATEYLEQQGLIDGLGAWGFRGALHASLTAAGLDCADDFGSSVSAYLNRAQGHGTTITNNTHFNAPVHGQVGIGGEVRQSQQQGIDGETLERLLTDVREAAEEIDPDDVAYLLAYVDTLRAEVVAEAPDTAMLQGSSNRLRQIAAKVGNPALAASVTTLTTAVLAAFGLSG